MIFIIYYLIFKFRSLYFHIFKYYDIMSSKYIGGNEMSLLGNLLGKQGTNINVVELKEKMESKPANVMYLDVRTPMEFKSKNIKGFKNIPVDQIPNRLKDLPKDKEIVIICQSGARSSSAVRFLKKNGYENIINVSGGMGAWMMHRF